MRAQLASLVERYFEPKSFELKGQGRLYRALGVRVFKHYLPTSGDLVSRHRGIRRIDPRSVGRSHALRQYERVTRSYESRHLFGAASMLAISWWAIAIHHKGSWVALLAANALINGYPIMIQRYNRVRLSNALRHLEAQRGGSAAAPSTRR